MLARIQRRGHATRRAFCRVGTTGSARAILFTMALLLAAGLTGLTERAASSDTIDAPFSNQELVQGFVLTVFGAEAISDRNNATSDIVKKFAGPVRYRIVSTARTDWRATVRHFLTLLSSKVANLDLIEARSGPDADLVIYLVDRADYASTIRRTVWDGVDSRFLESNACSAVIAARQTGIQRANIYLVADDGFANLSHCMVEEIAQSLGPANDSTRLPDSIFNDRSALDVFGLFDWFILNMLYDPRIRPGMTEAEARRVLPDVIADVRARVPEAMMDADAFHDTTTRR